MRGDLSEDEIGYPRDIFGALIDGNSPYAFYLFQWVAYQTDARRWRLKMKHDVRTFDGREAFGIWPNGSSCGPFKDEEVEFIRISRRQWGDEWKDPRPVRAVPEGGLAASDSGPENSTESTKSGCSEGAVDAAPQQNPDSVHQVGATPQAAAALGCIEGTKS